MGVKLVSSGGGSVEINPPATAVSYTATMPAGTGTVALYGQGTAVASTSGTSIDFTGIPSWVKRVTVMFNGVSTNGASNYLVQLGAGSVTSSGYTGSGTSNADAAAVGATLYTSGFGLRVGGAANAVSGAVTIQNITGNTWVAYGVLGNTIAAGTYSLGGNIALSNTLDRVRITTVNGTDTFDVGSINILYE